MFILHGNEDDKKGQRKVPITAYWTEIMFFISKAPRSEPHRPTKQKGDWGMFLICLEFLGGFVANSRNVRHKCLFSSRMNGVRHFSNFYDLVHLKPSSIRVIEATEGKEMMTRPAWATPSPLPPNPPRSPGAEGQIFLFFQVIHSINNNSCA